MVDKCREDEHAIAGLAFAEFVVVIEEDYMDPEMSPVFKLAELAQLYNQRWNRWESSTTSGCT